MRPPDRQSESALPREGWILYDGECGFCFRWVHFWKNIVERRGFAVKDLQSARADGALHVSQEKLLEDIRVLTRSGELESGADAYLYVAGKSGGHGLSTRSSACQALIECFGGAIVGLIEIDTESRVIVH